MNDPGGSGASGALDGLKARQWEQLTGLLSGLLPANRFYTAKFEGAGVRLPIESIAHFSETLPFTSKQELVEDQRCAPPYGGNLTFPLERYTRCHQTSGTTGSPLRWLDTPESWRWMLGNWIEVFRAAGVGGTDRVFFPFSFGPFIGFWLAFEAAAEMGCLCLPGGGLSTGARIRSILDHGATVLCATPTYAIRLAEIAADEGVDLRDCPVRTIIVAGEPGGSVPSTRSRLEALWPTARVFDHHGMTEVGPVTYECPAKPGTLHVIESAFITEIIDPETLRAVPEGQTGELVLTTLGRIGSPLIRYRTGDFVRAVPRGSGALACACGRIELALEGGILGRVDNMIIVRGVNVFPSAIEGVIRSYPEIGEYQVQVQTSNALTELKILVEPAVDGEDLKQVIQALQKRFLNSFSLRVPVTGVQRGTLPRFELKARRWVPMGT